MKKDIFILLIIILSSPIITNAAVFSVEASKSVLKGEEVSVRVFIDSGEDFINALSGKITLSPKDADILRIQDGGSVFSIWIENPNLNNNDNSISFSGITPGGFSGKREVFSFVMRAVNPGSVKISPSLLVVLKNDGKGTEVPTTAKSIEITVSKNSSTSTVLYKDVVSPEKFIPTLSSSPDVFDGKVFISFLAQDKGVGIDHYEYSYALFWPSKKSWKVAQSPFEVSPEALSKRVFIKAIDRLGNETVVSIPGTSYYQTLSLWVILSLLFICVLFFTRRYLSSR